MALSLWPNCGFLFAETRLRLWLSAALLQCCQIGLFAVKFQKFGRIFQVVWTYGVRVGRLAFFGRFYGRLAENVFLLAVFENLSIF